MPFSEDDKALVKNLHLFKGYGSRRLLAEFPMKNWTKGRLDTLLWRVKETGSNEPLTELNITF